MAKKTATAEDLQAEITRRLARHHLCSGCKAPRPKPAELARYLANWTVDYEPTVPGCSEALVEIVLAVMREYDLAAP